MAKREKKAAADDLVATQIALGVNLIESEDLERAHQENEKAFRYSTVDQTKPHDREVTIVDRDLLDQEVEVIVNAWNRNMIPWWLVIPKGRNSSRSSRRNVDRIAAVQIHHPCRWHQHAVAFLGTFDSRLSTKCNRNCGKPRGYESIAPKVVP